MTLINAENTHNFETIQQVLCLHASIAFSCVLVMPFALAATPPRKYNICIMACGSETQDRVLRNTEVLTFIKFGVKSAAFA